MERIRGFEVVREDARKNFAVFTDENKKQHKFPIDVKLPTRADKGSSGYDFYIPKDVVIPPHSIVKIYTDVKVYMQQDEELLIFIRSSMAIEHGLKIINQVGKIDSSYYSNQNNDGNIIIAIENTTGQTKALKAGERVAQGSFYKYLTVDNDEVISEIRIGGVGSSGK